MDINNLLAFMAVAMLLVVSPGPNGVLISKTVPSAGKKAGYANVGGFVAAFYVHGTLSIFGISLLLVQSAQAFMVFKLLGAAYLIWIGLKALMSAYQNNEIKTQHTSNTTPSHRSVGAAFTEGFLTNALNPKVSMFYLAAFPQFLTEQASPLSAYVLVTLHSLLNLVWFCAMVIMLSNLKQLASNTAFKRWLNTATGLIFVGFGSKLAFMKNT